MTSKTIIRVLSYDKNKHQFLDHIDIRQRSLRHGGRWIQVNPTHANIRISNEWLHDYRAWNNFRMNPPEYQHHPVFTSLLQLHDFNDMGAQLVTRLRHELAQSTDVTIEDYLPLFSNMQVGNAVSAWWHIKDNNYDYVVPVQHLPVSDHLKSRIMVWRVRKGKNWLDDQCCTLLNTEGHDIEEHLLWELNVRSSSNHEDTNGDPRMTRRRLPPSREASFESVHYKSSVAVEN